jgi:hypothetical protein
VRQQSSEGRVWRDAIAVAIAGSNAWRVLPQRLKKLFAFRQRRRPAPGSVALRIDPALGPVFVTRKAKPAHFSPLLAARLFANENHCRRDPAKHRCVAFRSRWRIFHRIAEPLVSDPIIPCRRRSGA